jgi:hypothetical protein
MIPRQIASEELFQAFCRAAPEVVNGADRTQALRATWEARVLAGVELRDKELAEVDRMAGRRPREFARRTSA